MNYNMGPVDFGKIDVHYIHVQVFPEKEKMLIAASDFISSEGKVVSVDLADLEDSDIIEAPDQTNFYDQELRAYFEFGGDNTSFTILARYIIFQDGSILPYTGGECLDENDNCRSAFTNFETGTEFCNNCTGANWYFKTDDVDSGECHLSYPLEYDPDKFYKKVADMQHDSDGNLIDPEGTIFWISCPGNPFFSSITCPIPDCENGYEPRPYYCKYKESLLEDLVVDKASGNNVGLILDIDPTFTFEINKTAVIKIIDKATHKPVNFTLLSITNNSITNTQLRMMESSNTKNRFEMLYYVNYCYDITIVLELYDSINE